MPPVIHHPHIEQSGLRRHPRVDAAGTVTQTGNRPGDVGAVAVVVIGGRGAGNEINLSGEATYAYIIIQVNMIANTAIDDRHTNRPAAPVGTDIPQLVGANSLDIITCQLG